MMHSSIQLDLLLRMVVRSIPLSSITVNVPTSMQYSLVSVMHLLCTLIPESLSVLHPVLRLLRRKITPRSIRTSTSSHTQSTILMKPLQVLIPDKKILCGGGFTPPLQCIYIKLNISIIVNLSYSNFTTTCCV